MGKRRSGAADFYDAYRNLGRKFNSNPEQNDYILTREMYWRVLTELAVNRFKWVGLPDEIDERFLEMTLFRSGLALFFWDDEYGRYFVSRCSGSGKINFYDNPTKFTATGNLMYNRTLEAGRHPVTLDGVVQRDETGAVLMADSQCVPIWANYMRTTDLDVITLYSNRLARLDQTIQIAQDNARMPVVVVADENTKHSWSNFMQQRDKGNPVIFGTQALDPSQAQAFDVMGHPETILNLQISRDRLWNNCMTLLGINNANQDKKERLVSDEVDANNEQVDTMRNVALKARKQAAAYINKRYDLSISVDFDGTIRPDTELTLAMGEML